MGDPTEARPVLRRLMGRVSWWLQSPAYHHGRSLKDLRRQATRLLFIARVRYAALLVQGQVRLSVSADADISGRVRIEVWGGTTTTVRIEPGVRIRSDVLLSLRGGSLTIGANTEVRRFVTLQVGGDLDVGAGVTLSTGLIVHCAEAVRFGDLTIVGEFSTITDSAHLRTPPGVPIHHATRPRATSIGSNVWIGAHAIIASGVVVGDQAFIGGGAVVLRDAPAGWLTAGNPARPIRELEAEA
jgi:acetyltransferase-like isoleucine patch superfamily enzyme